MKNRTIKRLAAAVLAGLLAAVLCAPAMAVAAESAQRVLIVKTDENELGKTKESAAKVSDPQTVAWPTAPVSPTGVVMRSAPYAIMVGAAVPLLAVSRRRKNGKEKEDEDDDKF